MNILLRLDCDEADAVVDALSGAARAEEDGPASLRALAYRIAQDIKDQTTDPGYEIVGDCLLTVVDVLDRAPEGWDIRRCREWAKVNMKHVEDAMAEQAGESINVLLDLEPDWHPKEEAK